MDRLDLQVNIDESLSGKVFLQLLSGDDYNRCALENIGAMMIVRGHIIVASQASQKTTSVPFETSFAHAESVQLKDSLIDDNIRSERWFAATQLAELRPTRMVSLKALRFPAHCPVESIIVDMAVAVKPERGSHSGNPSLPAHSGSLKFPGNENPSKDVFITQSTVNFKSYDSVKLLGPYESGYAVKEVLMSKITTHTLGLTLPKDLSSGVPSNVADSQSTELLDRFQLRLIGLISYHNFPAEITLIALVVVMWFAIEGRHVAFDPSKRNWDAILSWMIYFTLFAFIYAIRGFFISQRAGSRDFATRTFFANGWQAWSFCGVVPQGHPSPMYSMPSTLVENFHHGGVGTALPINQGYGTIPFHHMLPADKGHHKIDSDRSSKGWGDWSTSRSKGDDTKEPVQLHEREMMTLPEYRDHVASDMFTVLADTQARYAVVVGFLSQKRHFGCIATNSDYDQLSVHISGDDVLVPSHGSISTDALLIYTIDGALENALQIYFLLSGECHNVEKRCGRSRSLAGVPTGWCSWYHFYNEVNEKCLRRNLEHMRSMHESCVVEKTFNLFQIDDGYQVAWGDWTTLKPKFADRTDLAMVELVSEIHKVGMVGGIWLAPFACDKKSKLAKDHPDWILSYDAQHRKPANSANCGKFFYGLDVTNPDVQDHVRRSIRAVVQDWGFSYLKLDFLYAAALHGAQPSYYDRTLTKAQVVRLGMQVIVDELDAIGKPYYIVGCGAPLGSMIGLADANRISADAGLSWLPSLPLPYTDRWNLPSARNMIRNTLTRLGMHPHWWTTDPDCLVIRDSLAFSMDELIGIATAKALSGGSMIVSDDLATVSDDRLQILLKLLPPTNQSATAVDLFEREMPELFRLKCCKSSFAGTEADQHPQSPQHKQDDLGVSVFGEERSTCERSDTSEHSVSDLLLWKQLSRSTGSLYSPEGSFDDSQGDGLAPIPSVSDDEDDDSVVLKLPSERASEDVVHNSPGRWYQEPPSNIAQLNEDHVLTTVFPSPTVYSRKGPPGRSLSRTNSASNSGKMLLPGKSEGIAISYGLGSRSSDSMFRIDDADEVEDVDISSDEEDRRVRPPLKPRSVYDSVHSTPPNLMAPARLPLHPTRPHTTPLLENMIMVNDGDERLHDSDHRSRSSSGNAKHVHIALNCSSTISNLTYSNVGSHSHDFDRMCVSGPTNREINRLWLSAIRNLEQNVKRRYFDPSDLHSQWHLFAACNWSDNRPSYASPRTELKSHFVFIGDIFTAEELQGFMDYMDILYNKRKFRDKYGEAIWMRCSSSASKSRSKSTSFSASFTSQSAGKPLLNDTPNRSRSFSALSDTWNSGFKTHMLPFGSPQSQSYGTINYKVILHQFNFWSGAYHNKIVSLDAAEGEELGEVVFADIPLHSANFCSMSLSLHPMKPIYLGSNLHVSMGYEVRRMSVLQAVPLLHRRALVAYCNSALPRKRSKSNIFSSTISAAVMPKICSVCIVFEPGTLKDEEADGWIHVFLPVSYRKARAYNHVLGAVEVSGSASTKQLSPLEDGDKDRAVRLVSYVEEASCFTAGYVYKIPVRRATEGSERLSSLMERCDKGTPTTAGSMGGSVAGSVAGSGSDSVSSVTSGRLAFRGGPSPSKTAPAVPPLSSVSCASHDSSCFPSADSSHTHGSDDERDRDFVVVSWVFDLLEGPSPSTEGGR